MPKVNPATLQVEILTALKRLLNSNDADTLLDDLKINIEQPNDPSWGDYSSSVALKLWPRLAKLQKSTPSKVGSSLKEDTKITNPHQLAEVLKDELVANSELSQFCLISVAGAGFINFVLNNNCLLAELNSDVDRLSSLAVASDQKIMVEFTDPNPFKEFHIGHLYSNTVGEAISRLLQVTGAQVKRVCYQGDAGMHVAKAIWGFMAATQGLATNNSATPEISVSQQLAKPNLEQVLSRIKLLAALPLADRVKLVGQAYALGATAFEDQPSAKIEMTAINLLVFISAQEYLKKTSQHQPQVDYRKLLPDTQICLEAVSAIYEAGRAWSLAAFEEIYARLGTKFDNYFFESLVAEQGIQIVREYLKRGIFESSQGAVIFPGKKYGLHDRVFINSLGLPTYEAKELGLAPEKFKRFAYDRSIIITGNEIDEYFKVLLCALNLIRPDLATKTTHLSHGMVRLPEGKMSSRKGNVLTGVWLIDQAKNEILQVVKANRPDIANDEQEQIAEVVGVGAVKYALLKGMLGHDIAFNFHSSLSFEGNSGPYLHYTYARCRSVLDKAGKLSKPDDSELTNYQLNEAELVLARQLHCFSDVVGQALQELAVHNICTYLFELAQAFNSFYTQCQILVPAAEGPNPQNARYHRLRLTELTAQTLQSGLNLLGIRTVERM